MEGSMIKRAYGLSFAFLAAAGCATDNLGEESAELSSNARSIQNEWSGKCMDIPWGNAFVGQNVNEFPCNNGAAQKFVVEPESSQAGNVRIRFAGSQYNGRDLCVVPQASSPTPGMVQSWLTLDYCDNEYKGWTASPWPETTCQIGTSKWQCPIPLPAGGTQLAVELKRDGAYCLDAPGYVQQTFNSFYSPDTGWNNYPLQEYAPCHGGTTQKWDIRN
jgi:hypothetical protein